MQRRVLKRILLLLAALLIVSGCSQQMFQVKPHRAENFGVSNSFAMKGISRMRVAVLPFRNYARGGNVGTHIADEFSIQVLKTGRFDVIERSQMEKILEEKKVTDNRDYQELGKLLGVEGIFIGSIIKYEASIRAPVVGISVRLVDVETGSNLWASEEIFYGNDPSVHALVSPQDIWKVNSDVDYLTRVLCQNVAQTLNY